MSGPLTGIRVLEFAGLGPAPFAGMLLADLGADVLLVDRPAHADAVVADRRHDVNHRGKRSLVLDLKDPADRERARTLARHADILVEGLRPGVMERLGLGPPDLLALNPALVYGRMTGWGQDGPLAQAAGHDIDYIALAGALHAMGDAKAGRAPAIPLNLVGDFGGGSLYLVVGVLAALLHARASGQGQVVDAAMVDGTASLLTLMQALRADGRWNDARPGTNLIDGGRPWYDVYATSDGRHVAVGALEVPFYRALLRGLGLPHDDAAIAARDDPAGWPALRAAFAARLGAQPLAHWRAVFDGTDACVAPVLTMTEAATHPHLAARGTYGRIGDVPQAMPAPRLSRTPGAIRGAPPAPGAGGEQAWAEWTACGGADIGVDPGSGTDAPPSIAPREPASGSSASAAGDRAALQSVATDGHQRSTPQTIDRVGTPRPDSDRPRFPHPQDSPEPTMSDDLNSTPTPYTPPPGSVAVQSTTDLEKWTHAVYALHAVGLAIGAFGAASVLGSFLFGWPSIIAVIINYVKRSDVRGTWLESHFDWQIRTFWWALAIAAVVFLVSLPLMPVLLGFGTLALGFFALGVWAIYRIARGWLALRDRRPMPTR